MYVIEIVKWGYLEMLKKFLDEYWKGQSFQNTAGWNMNCLAIISNKGNIIWYSFIRSMKISPNESLSQQIWKEAHSLILTLLTLGKNLKKTKNKTKLIIREENIANFDPVKYSLCEWLSHCLLLPFHFLFFL